MNQTIPAAKFAPGDRFAHNLDPSLKGVVIRLDSNPKWIIVKYDGEKVERRVYCVGFYKITTQATW